MGFLFETTKETMISLKTLTSTVVICSTVCIGMKDEGTSPVPHVGQEDRYSSIPSGEPVPAGTYKVTTRSLRYGDNIVEQPLQLMYMVDLDVVDEPNVSTGRKIFKLGDKPYRPKELKGGNPPKKIYMNINPSS